MKLPLPIYESVKIGEQGEFSIFVGLDKNLIAQLLKYSADKSDLDLQKFTKDWKRFVEGTYEDWYNKNRTPFALVDNKTGIMAAQVRFGPEALFGEVDNWHTIGWRSYNPYRGKGLMKDFIRFSLNYYVTYFPKARYWITAKKDNPGSLKIAEGLGFKIDEENSKKETIAEGRESFIMIK